MKTEIIENALRQAFLAGRASNYGEMGSDQEDQWRRWREFSSHSKYSDQPFGCVHELESEVRGLERLVSDACVAAGCPAENLVETIQKLQTMVPGDGLEWLKSQLSILWETNKRLRTERDEVNRNLAEQLDLDRVQNETSAQKELERLIDQALLELREQNGLAAHMERVRASQIQTSLNEVKAALENWTKLARWVDETFGFESGTACPVHIKTMLMDFRNRPKKDSWGGDDRYPALRKGLQTALNSTNPIFSDADLLHQVRQMINRLAVMAIDGGEECVSLRREIGQLKFKLQCMQTELQEVLNGIKKP